MNIIPRVSIIIPIYKAEQYLEDCINSILTQSFTHFELLLVDDGSPDKSGELCEIFSKKDSRIRVFHKPNGGATSARKYGIENAAGEWIMFSDADDIIPKDSLQDLWNHKDGNCDIIAGTIYYKEFDLHIISNTELITINAHEYIHLLLNNKTYIGPCSKLIRKKLFDGIQWNEDKEVFQNEDLLMLIDLSAKSSRNIAISNNFIHYECISREGSLSTLQMSYEGWKIIFNRIKRIILSIDNNQSQLYSDYVNYVVRSIYNYLLIPSKNIPQDTFICSLLSESNNIKIQSGNIKAFRLISNPFYRFLFCKYRRLRMTMKTCLKKRLQRTSNEA